MSYDELNITAYDFFCGGGGASLGLHRAGVQMVGALNHSPVAIETHEANFPGVKHLLCDIRVQKSWGLGHADIMWASPDCTHHSIAKGGQSRDAKERALAQELPRFAYNLNVNCIMVENVKEFLDWGPVIEKHGKMVPDKARKGEYYRAWVATMQALGFVNYEYRKINAADFGAPQSRVRYFGIFTRRGVPIVWPEPTHDKHGANELPKWVAVRNVLDLNDRGRSIFTQWGKPIADKTLRRILAGLRKHVINGGAAEFLDKRTSNPPSGKPGTGASTQEPGPTLATCYLPDVVTPLIIDPYAWHGATRTIDRVAPTVVASQGKAPLGMMSVEYMLKAFGGNPRYQSFSLNKTAGSVTCADHHQFTTAYMVHHYSGGGQTSSICNPHPAMLTNPHGRAVFPLFLQQYNGGSDNCRVLSVDGVANTVPTENRFGVVQCLVQANGTRPNDTPARLTRLLSAQSPALNTNGGNLSLLSACLMSYYGNGGTRLMCQPCGTLCTHDTWAMLGFMTSSGYEQRPYPLDEAARPILASRRHQYLVLAAPGSPVATKEGDSVAMRLLKAVCRRHGIADIYMRMLKVSELKLIMGFPADYYLAGSATKQKEMLGNAVVPQVSEAIARAMLPSLRAARLKQLPKLRRHIINRWEQGHLFAALS